MEYSELKIELIETFKNGNKLSFYDQYNELSATGRDMFLRCFRYDEEIPEKVKLDIAYYLLRKAND